MITTKLTCFKIAEVDYVEGVSLVDNSVDLLSTINSRAAQSLRQWTKKRHDEQWIRTHAQLPIAEHGFSILIRVLIKTNIETIKHG